MVRVRNRRLSLHPYLFEPDPRSSCRRSISRGDLNRCVRVFSLDFHREYPALVDMGDLFPGEGEFGGYVSSHLILPRLARVFFGGFYDFHRWSSTEAEAPGGSPAAMPLLWIASGLSEQSRSLPEHLLYPDPACQTGDTHPQLRKLRSGPDRVRPTSMDRET